MIKSLEYCKLNILLYLKICRRPPIKINSYRFTRYSRSWPRQSLSLFISWIKHYTFPTLLFRNAICSYKKSKRKVQECHHHKPQPFPDPTRKRKPTSPNRYKPNKRTKSTKISSLFPKRGNRNTKRTEKHKNKMTHGKTYNKSPRRINHKATKSKTNTGTTALELTYFNFLTWYIAKSRV